MTAGDVWWLIVVFGVGGVAVSAFTGSGRHKVAVGGDTSTPERVRQDSPTATSDDGESIPPVVEWEPEDVLLNDQIRELNRGDRR